MPDPSAPRRAAVVVALTALALALPAAPALAQADPLSHLGTVTDPVTEVLAPSPSPSASPLVPVPEPLAPVVEPVTEAVGDLVGEEEPVSGQGNQPQPVTGPAAEPAAAPAPQPAAQIAPQDGTDGSGSASLRPLPGAEGLRTGTGTADGPGLGTAPLLAAAPSYALPGLTPMTAPPSEIAVSRSAPGPATPAGLPALVVAVAAVAVAAAGAGHVAELRVRRTS